MATPTAATRGGIRKGRTLAQVQPMKINATNGCTEPLIIKVAYPIMAVKGTNYSDYCSPYIHFDSPPSDWCTQYLRETEIYQYANSSYIWESATGSASIQPGGTGQSFFYNNGLYYTFITVQGINANIDGQWRVTPSDQETYLLEEDGQTSCSYGVSGCLEWFAVSDLN